MRGAGWLPAALAEAVERRAAPPGAGWASVPPPPRTPPALAGRTTADPPPGGAPVYAAETGEGSPPGHFGAVTADVPPGWPDPHAAVTADAVPGPRGAADVGAGSYAAGAGAGSSQGAVTVEGSSAANGARTAGGAAGSRGYGTSGTPSGDASARTRLTRRRMLVAAAAVPLAAGAALALREALSPSGRRAAASPHSSAPSAAGPSTPPRPTAPPTAVLRWRTKADDDTERFPDLYATSGVVVTANTTHTLHARGIDARTGRILWSHPIDVAPETRIAVGSDAVYLVEEPKGATSLVHAVAPLSGAVRWTYHVPELDFVWQLAASGTTALVVANSAVTALDSRTGHRRWQARPSSLDIQFMAAGHGLVVVPANGALTALELGSGRTAWRSRKAADPPQFALIGEGLVISGDNYGVLSAFHAADGRTAWRKTLDYRTSVSRTGGGMLFLDDQDGHVRALRAATGEEAWAHPPGQGRSAPFGGCTVLGCADGAVWVGTSTVNGTVAAALDAADGHVLWTYGADSTGDGSDAIDAGSAALTSNGLVLLGTYGGYIEAVSPPGGTKGTAVI